MLCHDLWWLVQDRIDTYGNDHGTRTKRERGSSLTGRSTELTVLRSDSRRLNWALKSVCKAPISIVIIFFSFSSSAHCSCKRFKLRLSVFNFTFVNSNCLERLSLQKKKKKKMFPSIFRQFVTFRLRDSSVRLSFAVIYRLIRWFHLSIHSFVCDRERRIYSRLEETHRRHFSVHREPEFTFHLFFKVDQFRLHVLVIVTECS